MPTTRNRKRARVEPEGPPTLLTKSEFARSLGVPRATVGAACKKGKALHAAVTGEGRAARIDPTHPAAVAWAASKRASGKAPNTGDKKGRSRRGRPTKAEAEAHEREAWLATRGRQQGAELAEQMLAARGGGPRPSLQLERPDLEIITAKAMELPPDIRAVLDFTVAQVVDLYGNIGSFEGLLKSAKHVADIEEKRTRTKQRRGELIERELVRTHVLGAVDEAMRRLVTDTPRTLTARVKSLVESGASDAEIEGTIREVVTQQIRGMKAKAKKGLALSKKQAMFAPTETAA